MDSWISISVEKSHVPSVQICNRTKTTRRTGAQNGMFGCRRQSTGCKEINSAHWWCKRMFSVFQKMSIKCRWTNLPSFEICSLFVSFDSLVNITYFFNLIDPLICFKSSSSLCSCLQTLQVLFLLLLLHLNLPFQRSSCDAKKTDVSQIVTHIEIDRSSQCSRAESTSDLHRQSSIKTYNLHWVTLKTPIIFVCGRKLWWLKQWSQKH